MTAPLPPPVGASPAPPTNTRMTVVSLQYLRAVASTMVVLVHASAALRQAGYRVDAVVDVGNAGVDVFFVISGVVMAWIVAPMDRHHLASFTRARVLRIVPLWWLATLAAYPALAADSLRSIGNLARSLVFVPLVATGTDRFTSIYAPGWTLSYEVVFYVLVGLSLFLPSRARLASVVAVLVAATAAGSAVSGDGSAAFFTDPIVLEFAAGLGIGSAALALRQRGVRLGTGLVAVLCVGHAVAWVVLVTAGSVARDDMSWRVLRWGAAAAAIVGTAVVVEMIGRPVPRWRLLEHLGDASYATYLTHFFTVRIAGEVWDRAGLTDRLPAGVLFALAVIASVAVGSAVHLLVDVPLRTVLSRWWPGRRDQPVVPRWT